MAGSIAFAYPVKAGSEQKVEEFMKGLLETDRKGQHHARSKDLGLKRIKVWRQREPSDTVIVYLEGPDVHESLGRRAKEDNAFDKWYDSMVQEITGITLSAHHAKGAPSELLFDWHHETGHSRTHQ